MTRTWVNGGPPFLDADNLNALEADVTTALGVPDAALAARVVAGATATALNATYVSMAQAQVGLDTDGVPYFASGMSFPSAIPVKTDTDGVPYIAA